MICENPIRTIIFALIAGISAGGVGVILGLGQPITFVATVTVALAFELANHTGYIDDAIEAFPLSS